MPPAEAERPEWPREASTGRLLCTAEQPAPPGAHLKGHPLSGLWVHEGGREVGEDADGAVAYYECRHCGAAWRAELAQ